MKPHFETYHFTTEICEIMGQSIVECRLSWGEIGNVLSVNARAVPYDCMCADGEIRYSGKLVICVVYEDLDKRVCRTERGAEFSHKISDERLVPAYTAMPHLLAENISFRREGSGLYISIIVGAKFEIYGESEIEYLYGGDDIVVKTENQPIVKTVITTGEIEIIDDFEMDYIGDVLAHSETLNVSYSVAESGQIVVSGEIAVNICAQKDNGLLSYERLVPFRAEIPCDEAIPKLFACAEAYIKEVALSLSVDEEKGKCKAEIQLNLHIDAKLFIRDEIIVVEDAYSTINQINCTYNEKKCEYISEIMSFTERVGGVASLTEPIDYSKKIESSLAPATEIVCRRGEKGFEIEGGLFADVILLDSEGNHKPAKLSLPFLFPINIGDADKAEVSAIVCGLNVKQRKEGVVEVEATLKISVKIHRECVMKYIASLEEGASFENETAAISVYLPEEGASLWNIAKKLHKKPEDLEKNNPEIEFPIKKGERIFVYRQKL